MELTPFTAPPVKPDDRIAVVSPATPFDVDIFNAGIRRLKELGFQVEVNESVYLRSRYTSGSPKERAELLNRIIADPGIKAVIAARGGYGSAHLLPLLNVKPLLDFPKRVIGCSDITTLLEFIRRQTGLVTYHGPMIAGTYSFDSDPATEQDFLAVLADEPHSVEELELEILVPGRAKGMLTGGCLSLLAASMGTPFEFQADEGILFLEDINEHPYRIDRMLTQLLLGNKLARVRGIVWGTMTGCEAPQGADYRLQDVLRDLLRPLGIPVYFGYPSGHSRPNLTLPFGAEAVMEKGRLLIPSKYKHSFS